MATQQQLEISTILATAAYPGHHLLGRDPLTNRSLISYGLLHPVERTIKPLGKVLPSSNHNPSITVSHDAPGQSPVQGAMIEKRAKEGEAPRSSFKLSSESFEEGYIDEAI